MDAEPWNPQVLLFDIHEATSSCQVYRILKAQSVWFILDELVEEGT